MSLGLVQHNPHMNRVETHLEMFTLRIALWTELALQIQLPSRVSHDWGHSGGEKKEKAGVSPYCGEDKVLATPRISVKLVSIGFSTVPHCHDVPVVD